MKRLYLLFARLISQPRSWLRAIAQRNRLETEMEAELAHHLDNLTADLIRSGQAPAEARRNALIALGSPVVHKDGMRGALGLSLWDDLFADLRYGVRMLRKNPGFTAVATISLALAIGANTTIFSLAKQLLYEQLAVPQASQLRLFSWTGDQHVVVQDSWGDWNLLDGGGITSTSFSYPAYQQLAAHGSLAGGIFAFKTDHMNATIGGEAQPVTAEMVSGNYYSVMGIRPQLGRGIQPADDAVPGAGTVTVISDGLWERKFARSAAVLGQVITVNQQLMTIVGVNPRGFTGAKSVQQSPEVFLPLSMQPAIDPKGKKSLLEDPQLWWVNVMGRAAAGADDAQAQAALNVQLQAAVRGTMAVKAADSMPRLELGDGSRGMHWTDRMFKRPVYVLLTLTGFVLLLACANIANLMLARGTRRQREMSVRLALGAGRLRILRQMLTESLMLATLGGAGGLMLGYLARNTIPKLLTNAWERNEINVSIDWRVFAFATGVTIFTGLLFGLAPAWSAARAEVGVGLKESAQTATRRRKGIGGKAIVGFQIALSTLLVIGALLFLRTLFALNSVNTGFRTDHLLLFGIAPPANRYAGGKDILLHTRLEKAFAAIPGVEAVTAADPSYISDSMGNGTFRLEGQKPDEHEAELMAFVGNDFLKTMGIPLIAGRAFGPQDTVTSPKVAIINQSLARARFPNTNPIGKRFSTGDVEHDGWTEIVGICADTRYSSLRDNPPPQFIMPYVQQKEIGAITYEIRTRSEPTAITSALRRAVASADPDLPMIDIRTQQEQIDANMQMERTFAALTAGFGVLALSLACVGIYGVMAYSVANRTNEIGIRLALGALPGQVLGMILREAAWISLAGVAMGLGAALALAQLVKSMLYGLQPNDPVSLLTGAALLIAVGLASSWIPAHRAASVEPMEALRHE